MIIGGVILFGFWFGIFGILDTIAVLKIARQPSPWLPGDNKRFNIYIFGILLGLPSIAGIIWYAVYALSLPATGGV